MNSALDKLLSALAQARSEVAKVIIGQNEVVELALITLLTRNHALIEGVPGVAKTLLVRTLAQAFGVTAGRVQFTPDLMPADITGTNVFNLQTNTFTLIRGPVFTSFLLADEINRAPAKTQAALLQAMQERTVTIDRDTHVLDPNFTVFATQNPAESEGTYPLPEAQKDRFMVRIKMSPPSREDELTLARRMLGDNTPENALAAGAVQPVIGPGELDALRKIVGQVTFRIQAVVPEAASVGHDAVVLRLAEPHREVIGATLEQLAPCGIGIAEHRVLDDLDEVGLESPDRIERCGCAVENRCGILGGLAVWRFGG